MSLKFRLSLQLAFVLPLVAAMMIGTAGSLHFWQGWVQVGVFGVFSAIFAIYFLRHDRRLVERRLRSKEPRAEQRLFKMLWVPLWTCTLVLPGLDYRFGWSAAFGGVSLWVTVACWILVAVSWWIVFEVLRFNTFASATVEVEAGQKVITDGPYRLVRHPMYSGFALMILATPLALGSLVACVPALLLIPVLVFRLLDEEQVLRKELPGYTEYCERTRCRLVPSLF